MARITWQLHHRDFASYDRRVVGSASVCAALALVASLTFINILPGKQDSSPARHSLRVPGCFKMIAAARLLSRRFIEALSRRE